MQLCAIVRDPVPRAPGELTDPWQRRLAPGQHHVCLQWGLPLRSGHQQLVPLALLGTAQQRLAALAPAAQQSCIFDQGL